MSLKSFL